MGWGDLSKEKKMENFLGKRFVIIFLRLAITNILESHHCLEMDVIMRQMHCLRGGQE